MDIGVLINEVEKARMDILSGGLMDGIEHLFRLKKSGYQVDISVVEDIVNIPNFLQFLYDETSFGDALTATRCLAALKGLNLPVDSRRINYVRYKKLSMLGKSHDEYTDQARPAVQNLLRTLRSFHVTVADFRECSVHKTESRITFEEEVTLRFPNPAFRDMFLQIAFQRAVEKGLNFQWENRAGAIQQDTTGRIGWFLRQEGQTLEGDWHRQVKSRFDDFLNSLVPELEVLPFVRCLQLPRRREDMLWVVFSRDTVISRMVQESLTGYMTVPVTDIDLLQRYLKDDAGDVGAFLFHVSIRDFDVIQAIVRAKIERDLMGPPFVVLAEEPFFHVMKDPGQLFSGCECLLRLCVENLQRLDATIHKVLVNRRRFLRIPVDLQCHALLDGKMEHTRATPISPCGTMIMTHRIVPVFSPTEVTLLDRESGFEETLSGNVIYNQRGGSAVRFGNVIPFEKFKRLQTITLNRHSRIVDTIQRSVL